MKTRRINIRNTKKHASLYAYFEKQCHLAKNLQNTANFYIRNLRTGLAKEPEMRSQNERDVIQVIWDSFSKYNENQHTIFHKKALRISKLLQKHQISSMAAASQMIEKVQSIKEFVCPTKEHWMLSYEELNAVLYFSDNRDYFALPSQANQQILRKVIKSWKSYFMALKAYAEHPDKFLGKPKMPGYKRTSYSTIHYTNQIINHFCSGERQMLSFPDRSLTLCIGSRQELLDIVKVEVKPWNQMFVVLVTYDAENKDPVVPTHPTRILGIDSGVNNFMAVAANVPSVPFLIDGKWLKSENQYFNKKRAQLLSILTKGLDSTRSTKTSKRLYALSSKRELRFRDFFYKTAYRIVRYALDLKIEVIVCTHNEGQKQESNLGDTNNQNFVSIPFMRFFESLKHVAAESNIPVILREESYTSKASLLDKDDIPTYVKGAENNYTFSGNRIKRGLYRSKEGFLINADINGACNVIRKQFPYAFDQMTKPEDFAYLMNTVHVITRQDLCHAKSPVPQKKQQHHRSLHRRDQHNARFAKKLMYMQLFDKKKATAYTAAA